MSDYKKSKIWIQLIEKCQDVHEQSAIEKLCNDAIELMKTVRDTFPTYTLHDERHIYNVIFLMEQLLGEEGISSLTLGECAMLVLAAFYHDIGMCYSAEDKEKELKSNQFKQYLEKNPTAYLQVEKARGENGGIPKAVQLGYFRSIHHIRVARLLPDKWNISCVRRDRLIEVCKSHGEDIEELSHFNYDIFQETDYVLCAILLRLSDVLDFDATRTPEVLYRFQRIEKAEDAVANIEWEKHMSARGFKFSSAGKKILSFGAVCRSMQIEHNISQFLDYIDTELKACGEKLRMFGQERWKGLEIPSKVERDIEREGYQTGEFCLTLDADNVLHLLVGDDLYISEAVFIRELMQNALDAVRARKLLDYSWVSKECSQIVVSSWIDGEGFQWFRIDDNGIGMTKRIILEYFLKIGRSYYQSAEFKKINHENRGGFQFTPISQFGIGILSCFLSGDRMEISTRHYDGGKGIRFSMYGIKGYYSIAEEEAGDKGSPMPSLDCEETQSYRQGPGTSIAVRMKEPLTQGIKKCLNKYLCYPDIEVEYSEKSGQTHIYTEQELMEFVKKVRAYKIMLPDDALKPLEESFPELKWEKPLHLLLTCTPLDEIAESPFISGADFEITTSGKNNAWQKVVIGQREVVQRLDTELYVKATGIQIVLGYRYSVNENNTELENLYREYKSKNDFTESCAEILENGKKGEFYTTIKAVKDKEMLKAARDLEFLWNAMQREREQVSIEVPFSIDLNLQNAMTKYILPRCETSTSRIKNYMCEIVYNGIRVRQTSYRSIGETERTFRYSVVLLSGRYKPEMGMNREHIRYLPLEAAVYMELLSSRIHHSGISCAIPKCYSELAYGDFEALFMDEKLCSLAENMLMVNHKVNIAEMKRQLRENRGMFNAYITNFDELFEGNQGLPEFYFSRVLLRAFLQKEFDVRWKKNEEGAMSFVITGIRSESISENERILYPLMFIEPEDGNTEILTEGMALARAALNASHPFAVWFLKNAVCLNKAHTGIFRKIREHLCNLNGGVMIEEVNELLKEVQSRSERAIPDCVWLKESDFIEFD